MGGLLQLHCKLKGSDKKLSFCISIRFPVRLFVRPSCNRFALAFVVYQTLWKTDEDVTSDPQRVVDILQRAAGRPFGLHRPSIKVGRSQQRKHNGTPAIHATADCSCLYCVELRDVDQPALATASSDNFRRASVSTQRASNGLVEPIVRTSEKTSRRE